VVHYEPDDVVLHANRPADAFYVLYSGKAALRRVGASGEAETVEVLTKGDFCGQATLLAVRRPLRPATCRFDWDFPMRRVFLSRNIEGATDAGRHAEVSPCCTARAATPR
jgi:CRP-like cAMP-binding protein